ncbi:spore coat putative kinase YutH [Scopulibacillus cellulosilyticus]|uniref:Spore coat putative kinase YutH n=1 Tax=Scopulibacillus cellulosilyticus TaxID=2665665 RepID=A0ABW2PY90_9BACL
MNNSGFDHFNNNVKGQNQLINIPLENFHHEDIEELAALAQWFQRRGEKNVAVIVPNQKGKWKTKNQGVLGILLAVQPYFRKNTPLAKELANFHNIGSSLQVRNLDGTPYVNGVDYWMNRLDDLLERYKECQKSKTLSDFEKQFKEVFPYFSGLGENAIQYMVDLRIEQRITEPPTICHHRFTNNTWAFGQLWVKSPADWVIDHPARDLAEWMRAAVWEGRSYQDISMFLREYHEEKPVTPLSKSLIMGRLLFPLPFIELCEAYFEDNQRHEQIYEDALFKTLSQTERYESFLKRYAQANMAEIKSVDWLLSNVQR